MSDDDLIHHAEAEFLDHATETMAEAVRLKRMLLESQRTGRFVGGWTDRPVDPVDVFESARFLRDFYRPG